MDIGLKSPGSPPPGFLFLLPGVVGEVIRKSHDSVGPQRGKI